jgi:hypothetical protein
MFPSPLLDNKKLLNHLNLLYLLLIKHQRLLGVLLNHLYPLDHLPNLILKKNLLLLVILLLKLENHLPNHRLENHSSMFHSPLLVNNHQRLLGVLLSLLFTLDHQPNLILNTKATTHSLRLYLFLCHRILMMIVIVIVRVNNRELCRTLKILRISVTNL